MTDPRVTPDPALVNISEPMQVVMPLADLTRKPNGPRDRQLIYGEHITALYIDGDFCLVRAEKDGYCGYISAAALGPITVATHRVSARSTNVYSDSNFKSADRLNLSFGSKIVAKSETPTFIETELGFIPRQHLHRTSDTATDPVAVASLFLGTPYLWGGNSAWGLDCSALVQAACLACGFQCPGDSDQQLAALGHLVPDGADYERGDLLFWKGHVALVASPTTLIHANAGHMAVVQEDIEPAISRIKTQGDGLVTGHKRLSKH